MELENEELDDGMLCQGSFDYEYLEGREGEEKLSEYEDSNAFSANNFSFMQQDEQIEQENELVVDREQEFEIEQESELEQENEKETTQEKESESQLQYKLHHTCTETLIKAEVKELILTEVTEVTYIKAMNDVSYELTEQIENLKTKEGELLTQTKELDTEVEIDKDRILQCEAILSKTKEMNELLKENVENLQTKLKRSSMKTIAEKSKDQHNRTEGLKVLLTTEIPNLNKKIKEMVDTWNDRNTHLKLEVERLHNILDDSKKKHLAIKRITTSYDDEIEKNLKKKQLLEQKLDVLNNTKGLNYKKIEDEIDKNHTQIAKLRLKKQDLVERFNKLTNQKYVLEKELEKCLLETNVLKVNVNNKKEETQREVKRLETLKNQLDKAHKYSDETVQNLQQNLDNICSQLNALKTDISVVSKNNHHLYNVLNEHEVEYMKKCEKKLELSKKAEQQQSDIQNLNTELTKQTLEKNINRLKSEELENHFAACVASLKSLNDDILHQKETNTKELEECKTHYEMSKEKQNEILNELKKKKEYSQATYNCLKEKSESLEQEVAEIQKLCMNLDEESNASLKMLIEKEHNILNNMKQKLDLLKKKQPETPKRATTESANKENVVKKVKFNEVISFKSTTEESETSSQALSQQCSKMDVSVPDWLKDSNSEEDP